MIPIERVDMMAGAVILASIAIGLAPFAAQEFTLDRVEVSFNSSVTVSESEGNTTNLGIKGGEDLEFGEIEPTANYTKWVNVGVSERSRVSVESKGNISELLRHRDVMYISGQTRIPVELFPHEEGYYDGEVVLKVWTPKNRLGELYLDCWQWKDRNL